MRNITAAAASLALGMGYCGHAAAGAFVLSGGSSTNPAGQVLAVTPSADQILAVPQKLLQTPAPPQLRSLSPERQPEIKGLNDLTPGELQSLTPKELQELIAYEATKAVAQQYAKQVAEEKKAAEEKAKIVKPIISAGIDTSDNTASVAATFNFDRDFHFTGNEDPKNFLTLKVSTPMEQGRTSAELVTLDGLTQSTSVALTGSFLEGSVNDDEEKLAFSFDASVGYDAHDYFDPLTLGKLSTTTSPWQAGASIEWSPKGNHDSITFSADYQQSFVDGGTGEAQTKCLPDLTCVTGFIGAPVRDDNALLSLVWRHEGKLGSVPFGIAPRVTYDPIQDAEAVSVPLYLATNDDDKLAGGVRYDWNSVTHVSTVGVFASTAFSVF